MYLAGSILKVDLDLKQDTFSVFGCIFTTQLLRLKLTHSYKGEG